ncbi:hypothetical protein PSQ19_10960 [Devosia algicola]|uniref:Curlin associated repeat-containing protein n=1 Tax=Devosia algicola TaxID=3026418 RepID=A0ABY7YJA2_9HYPH|nr:hypothetical protein [Devosia algicola]WDR01346.1 hypothetical protein PSQ19_10960 [Devosia algicola]
MTIILASLVQMTLGIHPTTGNTLEVTQDLKGTNTIASIEQIQDNANSANFATITQTGLGNWLQQLSQRTISGEGPNRVTLTLTGDYNGINGSTLAGAGPLAILAASVGAAASEIIQKGDLSGGAGNIVELAVTGDYNQFGVVQWGSDNSVSETITGSDNSFASFQLGQHNQIVSGGIAGDSNDIGIRQVGNANSASAVLNWSSSDNQVGIGQNGDANDAHVSVKGDHALIGVSQSGNGHVAGINAVGQNNVALAIQINDGATSSIGNTLNVDINGSGNNATVGGRAASFTGAALTALPLMPALPRSRLISPDATLLVSLHGGNIEVVPGLLAQWGSGNSIDIKIGDAIASNDNLFAVLQRGNGNAMSARVNGNGNQFLVAQLSDANIAAIEQTGSQNVAIISQ